MKEKLSSYNKKRNFSKTSEPSGAVKSSKSKRKFCIQFHKARRDHYDFRLEWKGVLLSWAVPKGPSFNPADKRLAVHVEDHPTDYASFEGNIPMGEYGGGSVMLWDEGTWAPIGNFSEGLKKGSVKFEVFGKRIQGRWALVQIKDKEEGKNWLLIKEKDEFAKKTNGISRFKTSIVTGRTNEQIANEVELKKTKLPFKKADVMLAKLETEIPSGKDFLFEVKYDGYRVLAFIENGKARLMSRNDKDFSGKFKSIIASLESFFAGQTLVLDGEMVVTDEDGKTDFQALQNYIKHPEGKRLTFMIFDLLADGDKDIRKLPLIKRKELLAQKLKNSPSDLVLSEHVIGSGKECFKAAEKLGLEGIIGKKVNSNYSGLRSGDWIKLKCYKRQEFVIGGYTRSEKKQTGISALLLGVYENGKLKFIGRAGTGLTEKSMQSLEKQFKKIIRASSPFSELPKISRTEKVFYLKPQLIAEIQFAELTDEGALRQASFKGLREDKDAKTVVLETAPNKSKSKKTGKMEVLGVEISSPDKIVFPSKKVRKIDIISYYQTVAKRMLPLMGNRVLSVVRCHGTVEGECFFKKHPLTKAKGTVIIPIKNSEGEKSNYFYINSVEGLISQAQLGTLEFHIWGSKATDLEKPDLMVFDLDPDKGMELAQIRQGVKDLKKVLQNLGLKSFLKTSGGKGYHVVVPFSPSVSWDKFHDFAKSVALFMEHKWPDRYTSNIRKDSRKGKIFIDWVRNGRGATSVAPYSLRSRKGAPVSMPISWSELDKVAPDGIDMFAAIERLKKPDPWKDFNKTHQKLKV